MQKIPTLFKRDPDDMKHVLSEVTPGCEWVLDGEGEATRKYDGTCVMLDFGGLWWARREVKPGKEPPAGFELVAVDDLTGKRVGWEPIAQSPFAKFHAEALDDPDFDGPHRRTYELCGPKINGNREGFDRHKLIKHLTAEPVHGNSPEEMIDYCRERGWEGVVWHHPDGRMAKLKVRDFDA